MDLSEKSLEEAIEYVARFVRDRGECITIKPTNVTYVEFRRRQKPIAALVPVVIALGLGALLADILTRR